MPAGPASERRRSGSHRRVHDFLAGMMECLVLVLVFACPWPFASAHPYAELVLLAGIAALLVLWSLRMLLEGRLGFGFRF